MKFSSSPSPSKQKESFPCGDAEIHRRKNSQSLLVTILCSHCVLNLGLAVLFLLTSFPASAVHAVGNFMLTVFLLLMLCLRFSTPFVLCCWAVHIYFFATRLFVCQPELGLDKWHELRFLVVPMQAFFITGVRGGSIALAVGTALNMGLPFWSHHLRDSLKCTAFTEEVLPTIHSTATFHFAIYVGISCVAYEWSRGCAFDQMQSALEEKENANKQLWQVTKVKERFAANASHELRTPLHGIIAIASDLLADRAVLEDTKLHEAINLVHECALHLSFLINDLLSFQMLSTNKPSLSSSVFSLEDEISQLWSQVKQQAIQKGVLLRLSLHISKPRCWGNAQAVRQVLLCLLSNAIKFTPEGGSVDLVIREKDNQKEQPGSLHRAIEFLVRDTGIGIKKDDLGSIFTGFSQLDDSLRREYGGNGLGLAISRRLVEAMGGTIGCFSEPNLGSTFTVTLPLPVPPESPSHPCDPEPKKLSCPGESAIVKSQKLRTSDERRLRVLLVEDNLVNQKVGVRILQSLGHSIDVVNNGAEAVNTFKQTIGKGKDTQRAGYDLILMDCQMPVMDGFKATKKIRKLEDVLVESNPSTPYRRLPILAVTASATQSYQDKCFACGMDDFLSKPLCRSTLQNALKKWSACFRDRKTEREASSNF